MMLAFVIAGIGLSQTASAQVCSGFALLKNGDEFTDAGNGRAVIGNRCYQRALCMGGTIMSKGGTKRVCMTRSNGGGAPTPACGDSIDLKIGERVWKRGAIFKTANGKCYDEALCGGNLAKLTADAYQCQAQTGGGRCSGTLNLGEFGLVWKVSDTMWKARTGTKCYSAVACSPGTRLTFKSGDTYYCKPTGPVCEGQANLAANQTVARLANNQWKIGNNAKVFCTASCPADTLLTHKGGNNYYCKPKPPVCEGTATLIASQQVAKLGNKQWRVGNNGNVYCDVVCPADTDLTHKGGNTYYCEPQPPVCDGVGQLTSGQEIWRKAANMWKTKDGRYTYCSVRCPVDHKLTHKSGDTHYCKPNPPVCDGHGNLNSGQEIWKKAHNMWKPKTASGYTAPSPVRRITS